MCPGVILQPEQHIHIQRRGEAGCLVALTLTWEGNRNNLDLYYLWILSEYFYEVKDTPGIYYLIPSWGELTILLK